MRGLSLSSVRTRVIFLFLLVLVPLTFVFYFNYRQLRRHAAEHATGDLARIVNFAVIYEERILLETRQILWMLANNPAIRTGGKGIDELLGITMESFPQYANFGVASVSGDVYGSALPLKKPVNISDRSYFQHALANRSFSIGRYQVGRVTGIPTVNFGFPIMDSKGAVTAVIYAALDLSTVERFVHEIESQTPANSTYVKLDSNGLILSAYPSAQFFGRGNPLEKDMFERVSKEKKGTFESEGADGIDRLYVFSSLQGYLLGRGDAYVVLGIPLEGIFAEPTRMLARNVTILALVVGVSLIIMWIGGEKLIIQPVRVLTEVSNRLSAGDLTARSGLPSSLGELGRLGQTFDGMGEKLQQEMETRLRMTRAIEQSAETIVITDTEGKIEYVNPSFERITGYSRDEATGNTPRILKSGKHDEAFYKKLWGTITSGETFKGHMTNRKKDGSFFEEEATISPVFDTSGKIINFVAVKRDITREQQLRRQVQTAQRMEAIGTLAGGIAHDFNNALTGIFGFGEMLKSQLQGNDQALSNLNEIMRSAERASLLTRQLLTYSRRQIIEPVNLSLNHVIMDLLKLLSKVVGEHIEIRTFLGKDLPAIRADVGQMEQVIMNLVLNSRDAMPSGGQLTMETELARLDEDYVQYHPYMSVGTYLLLTVSDTGVGMDQKTQERSFEPFFTTKAPERGSGLGLAMVYGIVKQHNGFIHLYSEPGKGTTIKIYFPPTEAAPDIIETAKTTAILGGTETILLAEDDESVRMLIERTLRDLGYTVLVTRNGEEAVETFHGNEEKISLAVLDVVMPLKGGKEAYEAMCKVRPGLKVIFMSGYTANAVHESFVLIAGMPFLSKPFGPGTLARKVREVLDKA